MASLLDDPYHTYTPQQQRFVDEMRKVDANYVLPAEALAKKQHPKILSQTQYTEQQMEDRRHGIIYAEKKRLTTKS